MKLSTGLSALLAGSVAASTALDACLANASIPVAVRNSTAWAVDTAPFNMRLPYTPAAVVLPRTVADVQAAVQCAARLGVRVSPKGGGHSYASFGLGGEDGHLVLEMEGWDTVTVDATTQVATIQAGARLGHVFTQLQQQGGRALSHGTCPDVGIGGHALHGGFGFSSFTHGLALDAMVGADVVLADGRLVHCSATENVDLFWALRGAGSSYGVVVTFYFDTFAAPTTMTVYQATLPWTGNVSACVAGWTALQGWALSGGQPREMNMRVFGMNSFTALHGVYHGTKADLQTAIQPLLDALGTTLYMDDEMDWYNAFVAYDNNPEVDIQGNDNANDTFYANSLITKAMPPAAMQDACQYWMTDGVANKRDWFIIMDLFGGPNGYISNAPSNTSAFAHRDKLFLFNFYDTVYHRTYPSDGIPFVQGWTEAFTAGLNDTDYGMYANYVDPEMNRTYAQQQYYGSSLPRLQHIKALIDPNQVIDYPQGVQPAGRKRW